MDALRSLRSKSKTKEGDGSRSRSPRGWLKDMKRNASGKRGRSPFESGSVSPAEPAEATGIEQLPKGPDGKPAPAIPGFLCMTLPEVHKKFQELNVAERTRNMMANMSGSPNHHWTKVSTLKTRDLDRYANISPFEGNRVRLNVPADKNSYVNASPIKLTSRGRGLGVEYWIAMQGPLSTTISHTWRMIYEQVASPGVIIMLTETHDGKQEKCHPYFPMDPSSPPILVNEIDEFGDGFKAAVRCEEIEQGPFPDAIQIRKLVVKAEGNEEEKIVWHLWYTAWPDFGVPELGADGLHPLLALGHLSQVKNLSPANPRLIHCSAGVGRTGTFIALQHLLGELDRGVFDLKASSDTSADHYDPVWATVDALRQQRTSMVQGEGQFLFLYQVIREMFEHQYPGCQTFQPMRPTPADSGQPSSKVARRRSMDDVFS